MNDDGEYYLNPTPGQLEHINELIDQLPSVSLSWLHDGIDGWANTNLDFWLENWGRAEDLINTLEQMITGEAS